MPSHGNFNPRSREGSDRRTADIKAGRTCISIHAPVKGATRMPPNTWVSDPISIHAPVKGATRTLLAIPWDWVFQSTLP